MGHHVLVRQVDVNPWKLLGFAMYTTPHTLTIEIMDETEKPRRLPIHLLSAEASKALTKFRGARLILGQLRSPRLLAQAIFHSHPTTKRLAIAIGVTQLNGKTSFLERRVHTYRYP